jgi:heme exporter protein D
MGGLATAQWIAIGMVVVGLVILVLRHLFWNREELHSEEVEVEA